MSSRRRFTREYKQEAVQLVAQRGVTVAQAARDLGLNPHVLRKWVREQSADPVHAFPREEQQKPEQAELTRLRREVAKLKMERDILNSPRPTSQRSRCEIRLCGEVPSDLAGRADMRGARCLAQWILELAHACTEYSKRE